MKTGKTIPTTVGWQIQIQKVLGATGFLFTGQEHEVMFSGGAIKAKASKCAGVPSNWLSPRNSHRREQNQKYNL